MGRIEAPAGARQGRLPATPSQPRIGTESGSASKGVGRGRLRSHRWGSRQACGQAGFSESGGGGRRGLTRDLRSKPKKGRKKDAKRIGGKAKHQQGLWPPEGEKGRGKGGGEPLARGGRGSFGSGQEVVGGEQNRRGARGWRLEIRTKGQGGRRRRESEAGDPKAKGRGSKAITRRAGGQRLDGSMAIGAG